MEEEKYIEAKIISVYSYGESFDSYLCKLKYSGKFQDKFVVYLKKSENVLTKGDIISFYSKIINNNYYNNYNEFNSKLYLNSKGIIGNLFAQKYDILKDIDIKKNYKEEFKEYLENTYSNDISRIIQAIVLGDKEGLSIDMNNTFNEAGISHMLVVSGTAIYILKKFLLKMFKKSKYKECITIFLISLYVFFCNFSISIIRAYIMFLITIILRKFKIKIKNYEIIIISAYVILIINPYYIFSYSFWYTFMAVFGIRMFFLSLTSKLNVILLKIFRVKHYKYIKNKLLFNAIQYLICNFSLTVSVQIMLFPLIVYSCSKIYILSIFSNLIINILSIVEYILGFILIITFKVEFISNIVSYFLGAATKLIIYIAEFFQQYSNTYISFNKINLITVITLYLVIIYINYGYIISFKLKYILSKNIFKIVENIFKISIIIIILIDIIFSNFVGFVYYFNIGQGNMAITKYNDVVIVSDIGSSSCDVKYILLNFMKAYKINQLDYLFLSHMHEDHINGLLDLEEEIKSGEIIISNICARKVNNEVKEMCIKYNINLIYLKQGDNLIINDKIKINILSPHIKSNIISSDLQNSNSLVYTVTINNKSFMFMGDATTETERVICNENIIKRDIYCLQAAHHGSKTSTCEEYLKYFSFKYATISSEYKMYNHPSSEIIKRLNNNNISCFILEKTGGKRFYIY